MKFKATLSNTGVQLDSIEAEDIRDVRDRVKRWAEDLDPGDVIDVATTDDD